jgi:hypothetical protein
LITLKDCIDKKEKKEDEDEDELASRKAKAWTHRAGIHQ